MNTFKLLLTCMVCSTVVFARPSAEIDISKCTVSAGKGTLSDSITLSGTIPGVSMGTVFQDALNNAQAAVEINCTTMPAPLQCQFDVNPDSFKKGKFSGKNGTAVFTCDTKNGKISFSAKNVNLTGLQCPFELTITIGIFSAVCTLEENVVNGTKPCPLPLMMGVMDSLTVDAPKVKMQFGKTSGTDSLTVSGFFTIADDYDKNEPLVITLGTQIFPIPGDLFICKNGVETCNNQTTHEGPIVSSKLDFNNCTYIISVKNAVIKETGDVDFAMQVFGNKLKTANSITIPSGTPRYELERYRCYDKLGRDWTYSADYNLRMILNAPDFLDIDEDSSESGTMTGNVSVASTPVYIDNHECRSVSVSTDESMVSYKWYEDYYGTHQYSWVSSAGNFSFEVDMDFPLVIPELLTVGQTYKNSGPFTGEFNLDIGYMDISDFKGTMSSSITLLGFETVTVPYNGGTTFDNAAKFQFNEILSGSMVIEVDGYRIKANFQATVNQTGYGVEDFGIVKSNTDMIMKLTISSIKINLNMTENDVLTDYSPN